MSAFALVSRLLPRLCLACAFGALMTGAGAYATITVAPGSALGAAVGLVATASDPGNGVSNLLEYAFDLDPLVPDSAGLPVARVVNVGGADYLALAYTRAKLASDLTYAVEASGDLDAWTSTTPVEVGVTDHGDTETVLVRDAVATASGARRFLRVRVTFTP